MTPGLPTRRAFAVLVLGVVAFTVYGSLVPFTFEPLPWGDATARFARCMRDRVGIDSRSDALANVLLGVPLGFGLLGLVFAGRPPNPPRELLVGLVLLPGCGLFAAAVEFAQVYVPVRTCSGADVLCQVAGAAAGTAVWLTCGRGLAGTAAGVWGGTGSAPRVLLAYLALLAFVQVLPLNLNASPRSAAKKALREVNYVPFGELLDAPPGEWGPVEKAAKLFGLFVPLGLLAARLPGRFWGEVGLPRVVALALAAAAGLEAIQLPVESRMPSATDAVVGAAGATAGWLIGRNRRLVPLAGLGWLVILAAAWGPLPPVGRDPPAAFDWVPGLSLESGDPLFALEDVLTKLILFGLGGAVVGAMGVDVSGRLRATIGAVTGLLVSGVIEATQMGYGAHTPAVTDVLLGGLGAALGANIVGRTNRK